MKYKKEMVEYILNNAVYSAPFEFDEVIGVKNGIAYKLPVLPIDIESLARYLLKQLQEG